MEWRSSGWKARDEGEWKWWIQTRRGEGYWSVLVPTHTGAPSFSFLLFWLLNVSSTRRRQPLDTGDIIGGLEHCPGESLGANTADIFFTTQERKNDGWMGDHESVNSRNYLHRFHTTRRLSNFFSPIQIRRSPWGQTNWFDFYSLGLFLRSWSIAFIHKGESLGGFLFVQHSVMIIDHFRRYSTFFPSSFFFLLLCFVGTSATLERRLGGVGLSLPWLLCNSGGQFFFVKTTTQREKPRKQIGGKTDFSCLAKVVSTGVRRFFISNVIKEICCLVWKLFGFLPLALVAESAIFWKASK